MITGNRLSCAFLEARYSVGTVTHLDLGLGEFMSPIQSWPIKKHVLEHMVTTNMMLSTSQNAQLFSQYGCGTFMLSSVFIFIQLGLATYTYYLHGCAKRDCSSRIRKIQAGSCSSSSTTQVDTRLRDTRSLQYSVCSTRIRIEPT